MVTEPWWGGPTAVMMTIFPSVIFQQQVNSVSTRHIQPDGHGAFDFVWTHFGFADDTTEMTRRRLRQANLFGPAGFVSADDGEVIEFSQQSLRAASPAIAPLAELGGRDVRRHRPHGHRDADPRHVRYWREVMEAMRPYVTDAGSPRPITTLAQLYADYASVVDSGQLGPAGRSSSSRRASTSCSRARTSSAACRSRRCRSRARAC